MDITKFLEMGQRLNDILRDFMKALFNSVSSISNLSNINEQIEASLLRQEQIENHRKFLEMRYASKNIVNQKCQNQVYRYWNNRSKYMNIVR